MDIVLRHGVFDFCFIHQLIDIILVDSHGSTDYSKEIRQSEAPINSGTMLDDGRIYAHPLFERHLKNKLYVPGFLEETTQDRHAHLAKKIHGLKLVKIGRLPKGPGNL